jgi:hypothetical protein
MFPNPGTWAWHFRHAFIVALRAFRRGVSEKVVPAFDNLAQEADDLANAEYERLGSIPAYDDSFDMSDVADWANNAAIDYYQTMRDVRQGVVNVLAIGLHHLLEQQRNFFVEREPLPPGQQRLNFDKRLSAYGIDSSVFSCASTLRELRAAANALKHASTAANKALLDLRPDLFANPALKRLNTDKEHLLSTARALAPWADRSPMAGDHIYVQESDLAAWCDAAIEYWETIAETLNERYGHRSLG